MTRCAVRIVAAVAAVLALAGCGGTASVAGSSQPNASQPNAYLATGSGWVNYLQWNSAGTGTFTEDTLTGTAPDEQMTSDQTPITVVVNGSQVTFTGLQQDYGTLAGGTLMLQVLTSDGTLGTDTFTPATQGQFNQAVAARRRPTWPPCRPSASRPTWASWLAM